jgi:hypothetical protein
MNEPRKNPELKPASFLQMLERIEHSDPLDWNQEDREKVLNILDSLSGFVDRVFDVSLDLSDIQARISDPESYRS